MRDGNARHEDEQVERNQIMHLFMLHSPNTHTGILQIMKMVLQIEGQGEGKMDYSTNSMIKASSYLGKKIN